MSVSYCLSLSLPVCLCMQIYRCLSPSFSVYLFICLYLSPALSTHLRSFRLISLFICELTPLSSVYLYINASLIYLFVPLFSSTLCVVCSSLALHFFLFFCDASLYEFFCTFYPRLCTVASLFYFCFSISSPSGNGFCVGASHIIISYLPTY